MQLQRLLFPFLLLPAACADATLTIDDIAEQESSLVSGTVFGIDEGTPKAQAIQNVASTFSNDQLRNVVSLFSQATTNVLQVRATLPGNRFASLAVLDAVPFVGPASFRVLGEYIDRNILLTGNAQTGLIGGNRSLTYQFSAVQGQTLRFQLRQINGTSWNPRVRLFSSTARVLAENPPGNVDVDETFTVTTSEIFDLVIANTGSSNGTYQLEVNCLNNCRGSGVPTNQTVDPRPQLRTNYQAVHQFFSYRAARTFLFTDLDNFGGTVTGAYTNATIRTNRIPDPTIFNTEHAWPQSLGATGVARTDLHHLYPVAARINSSRGNRPFCNVIGFLPGDESALGRDADGDSCFEVQDRNKGNIARSLFYFSTMYQRALDAKQEAVLRSWHQLDPVDNEELARNDDIASFQGSRNPYIDQPTLVGQVPDF